MIDPMNVNAEPRKSERRSQDAAGRVLAWFDRHRRSLPWRAASGQRADPYLVWLSEILLQQTNVPTATPYFERFRALWPRVEDLAAAPLDEVMRAFAGLGYYSRARNLHACAIEIAARGGRFPSAESDLRALPGIGAYTAAAIAAIAFGRKASPVDGNIARIVTRLFAIEEPIVKARAKIAAGAAALTPCDRPGDFAQALMDIGAAICTPRNPDCPACPMQAICAAAASGDPQTYPRKSARKERPARRGAAFFAEAGDGGVLLRTRPPNGLLGATVELPGTAWSVDFALDEAAAAAPLAAAWRLTPGTVDQIFTHFSLRLTVYAARLQGRPPAPEGCFWVEREALDGVAFSSLMRKAVAHGRSFTERDESEPAAKPVNKRPNGPSTKKRSSP
jgi:A/G-specific adenine glycosylase